MSGPSPIGIFAVVFMISLVLVMGGMHNGRGNEGGGFNEVHRGRGPPESKPERKNAHLLKCVQCQGESFEECSNSEVSRSCPPGSSARACLVTIGHTKNSKITIEKQCTMAEACARFESERPKSCLLGDIGDKPCHFCCGKDDCNTGWPKPQFDQHCDNWAEWSYCHANCGPGKQARKRTCSMEIVGYNLWQEHTLGSVLAAQEKTQNKSAVNFLPIVPASVTEPKDKWQYQRCQIRPCEAGEKPVLRPMPPNGGSEGLTDSVLFITLWFMVAWYL